MPVITETMIAAAYIQGKKFYSGEISRSEAIDYLIENYKMNPTSASHYIQVLDCMMKGTRYSRNINNYSAKYFLRKIFDDFGYEGLSKALNAVKAHIEYYAKLPKGGNLVALQKILDDFSMLKNSMNQIDIPEEIPFDAPIYEGAKKTITVNIYERDPAARDKCLDTKDYKCLVCDFEFYTFYGELGKQFIHVHHVKPLSTIGQDYIVDPISDLVPVCPNCHAMLHKKKPEPYSIEELKKMILSKKLS
ncbi:HNH endonuclease [Geovibrio thiophilus]|nr:HNH endonuclease [Geovibrio thiophilus]